MDDTRKQKLIALGAESLAEALLQCSLHSSDAQTLIEALITSPEDQELRIRERIHQFCHHVQYMQWGETSDVTKDLSLVISDISEHISDPVTGIALTAMIYEMDEVLFEHFDDSYGDIGELYDSEVVDLFVSFATRCPDEHKIVDLMMNLNSHDYYGVRHSLIKNAGLFLSEATVKNLISSLLQTIENEHEELSKQSHLYYIKTLAVSIKDPVLYEQAVLQVDGSLGMFDYIELARLYLERGSSTSALTCLDAVPDHYRTTAAGYKELLMKAFRMSGDRENLLKMLQEQFQSYRSPEHLKQLLDILGEDKREEVIHQEIQHIQDKPGFSVYDASFLIEFGQIDEAEAYITERAESIHGDMYYNLLELTEILEQENRYLAASLIYRSLTISILRRGRAQAYHHGRDYMVKLDDLSQSISDWNRFEDHQTFKTHLYQEYSRKYSFWKGYTR